MAGEHYPRPALSLTADQAADTILLDGAQRLQVTAHERADLGLVPWDAVRLSEFP
jgi:hypothetical protein